MRRAPAALLIVGVAIASLVAPQRAFACSCNSISVLDAVRNPGPSFLGTAADDALGGTVFIVAAWLDGDVDAARVRVWHDEQDGVNCGSSFAVGRSYLVNTFDNGLLGLQTNMCTGTIALGNASSPWGIPAHVHLEGEDRFRRLVDRGMSASAAAEVLSQRLDQERAQLTAGWITASRKGERPFGGTPRGGLTSGWYPVGWTVLVALAVALWTKTRARRHLGIGSSS